MNWNELLKDANVSIHVIATGAGSQIQQQLWDVPGCSAYFSGAQFPYATEETVELLGFKPQSFCSVETAIDLASVAYMKAFKLGGKNPVGLGVTATVASAVQHRGSNRFHTCVMTNDKVRLLSTTLTQEVGMTARWNHDDLIANQSIKLLVNTIGSKDKPENVIDVTEMALQRLMERPFFAANGQRLEKLPHNKFALMPGSFNPPHEGHLGIAEESILLGQKVVFEIGSNPPHKEALTVQDMLRRAKMLKGHNTLFTSSVSLFIDKAKAFPESTLMIGADTLIRLFDPKWGVDKEELLKTFKANKIKLAIFGRVIDGTFVPGWKSVVQVLGDLYSYSNMFVEMPGRWDISSTELRNKLNG